ncbi:MAG: NUDIX domain-containing protein [Micavibrio sp.]|nr:NUDIX domain-containing protein [Micavibrio sp.]
MQIHNLSRLVIRVGGHLLLTKAKLKDGSDYFFLPGGHIEYHETIQEAAIRELKEEINIDRHRVSDISLVGIYEHSWDNKGEPYHEIAFISTCSISGLDPEKNVDSSESHIMFEWHPINDLTKINFLPVDFRTLLPKWLSQPIPPDRFFASNFLTK